MALCIGLCRACDGPKCRALGQVVVSRAAWTYIATSDMSLVNKKRVNFTVTDYDLEEWCDWCPRIYYCYLLPPFKIISRFDFCIDFVMYLNIRYI